MAISTQHMQLVHEWQPNEHFLGWSLKNLNHKNPVPKCAPPALFFSMSCFGINDLDGKHYASGPTLQSSVGSRSCPVSVLGVSWVPKSIACWVSHQEASWRDKCRHWWAEQPHEVSMTMLEFLKAIGIAIHMYHNTVITTYVYIYTVRI